MPPTRILAMPAVAAGLVSAALAWAEGPKAGPPGPVGIRRGEPTVVTIPGSGLEANPRLVLPFEAEVAAVGLEGAAWKVRVAPKPGTPIGVYLARVRTEDGLSGPFPIAVGQVAGLAEAEENGTFEAAQPIPTPVAVEGRAEGNDVDFFRFAGRKGQKILIDAQCARVGSGVDPSIRLTTSGRAFVGSADDTPGLATDARLVATLPEDGDYVVELSDSRYGGAAPAHYRLLVGPIPSPAEVFPLGGRRGETIGLELRGGTLDAPAIAAATLDPPPGLGEVAPRIAGGPAGWEVESLPTLAVSDVPEFREPIDPAAPPLRALPPAAFNGRIEPAGDADEYALAVAPGQVLRIAVDAAGRGSSLDAVLQVKGAGGAVLATADDTPIPPRTAAARAAIAAKTAKEIRSADPSLKFTVPPNVVEIALSIRDLRGEGGPGHAYRILVDVEGGPRFDLSPAEPQVNIPRGGTAAVEVEATRSGYAGPITLAIADPPPGLVVRPGLIPPGQGAGTLTITAPAESGFDLATLNLIGEGEGGLRVAAGRLLILAEQANLATATAEQAGLPASIARPRPIALDAPATPIEVIHGERAAVSLRVARLPGSEDAALTIGSRPLPTGFAIDPTPIPPKADAAVATVTTTPATPLGPAVVAITANGPIGGREQTFDAPAVRFEVVRPALVELATPSVEVKAGGTAEVKGKVIRRPAFRGQVSVKLDGLPAGLKAEPATLGPDAAEFALTIAADPKAAAAAATAQLGLAFQVAGKDYPMPATPLAVKVAAAP